MRQWGFDFQYKMLLWFWFVWEREVFIGLWFVHQKVWVSRGEDLGCFTCWPCSAASRNMLPVLPACFVPNMKTATALLKTDGSQPLLREVVSLLSMSGTRHWSFWFDSLKEKPYVDTFLCSSLHAAAVYVRIKESLAAPLGRFRLLVFFILDSRYKLVHTYCTCLPYV